MERLIDWLDATDDVDQDTAIDDGPCDDDPDLEPCLGSFEVLSNQIHAWEHRACQIDLEHDDCDYELSLVSVGR